MIPKEVYERFLHEKAVGIQPTMNGVLVAMNREMRRRAEKQLGHKLSPNAAYDPESGKVYDLRPIHVPKPVSKAEALDRVTEMLTQEMAKYTHPGTVVTLKNVLDRAEAEIVERAWRAGQPIPRELVRKALQEIHQRGENRRRSK
jgi:hypothetical protein